MRAFVLCGGKGTRLRPYTYSIPKPMLPLGRKPILEFVIENLKRSGLTDIVLTVGYLKEQIKEHFGDGSRWGVRIVYSEEKTELNTAGSILPLKDTVKGTFVVVMGDHLSTLNIKKMVEYHRKKGGIGAVGLKKQGVPLEYGIAKLDDEGKIIKFEEKPIVQNLVNSASYVFEPEIYDYIKPNFDFARDVFPAVLAAKKRLFGYVFDEYWMDIGRIHDYDNVNQMISMVDLVIEGKV
ncbi:MAG: nucleotidyltransferase family protein [Candidatus Micrarchaeota archaeon]